MHEAQHQAVHHDPDAEQDRARPHPIGPLARRATITRAAATRAAGISQPISNPNSPENSRGRPCTWLPNPLKPPCPPAIAWRGTRSASPVREEVDEHHRFALGVARVRPGLRTGRGSLRGLDAERVQDSDEAYLIAPGGENVKARDDLMDIKVLREVNDDGLQR